MFASAEKKLFTAIQREDAAEVERLLAKRKSRESCVAARDAETGETALMQALRLRRAGIVTLLLQAEGIAVNAVSLAPQDGGSGARAAAATSSGAGQAENASGTEIIRRAHQNRKGSRGMKMKRADSLASASASGDAAAAAAAAPLPPAVEGSTALHVAVLTREEDLVRALLDHADLQPNLRDRSGHSPLEIALRDGQEGIALALLGHRRLDAVGVEDGPEGRTPLMLAALGGMARAVQAILEVPDVDPNECTADGRGRTALTMAVESGSAECVRLLMEDSRTRIYSHALTEPLHPPFRMATGGDDQRLIIWDTLERACEHLLDHPHSVTSASFRKDGGLLATGCEDHVVRLYEPESGSKLHDLTGHNNAVNDVAFSPDGARLVSGASDFVWRIWDTAIDAPRSIRAVKGHQEWIQSVAWHPDAQRFVTCADDGCVKLWRVDGKQVLRTFRSGDSDFVHCAAVSHNGAIVAAANGAGNLLLWELETGRSIRLIDAHRRTARAIDFSADDTMLASGGADNLVKVWNVESGELVMSLEGHTEIITAVAFSPDRTRLASCAEDGDVRVWVLSGEAGECECVLGGHNGNVLCVAWSPYPSMPLDGITSLVLEHANVNLNLQDDAGNSLLMRAVTWDDEQFVRRLLLDARVNVHLRNKQGKDVCVVAREMGRAWWSSALQECRMEQALRLSARCAELQDQLVQARANREFRECERIAVKYSRVKQLHALALVEARRVHRVLQTHEEGLAAAESQADFGRAGRLNDELEFIRPWYTDLCTALGGSPYEVRDASLGQGSGGADEAQTKGAIESSADGAGPAVAVAEIAASTDFLQDYQEATASLAFPIPVVAAVPITAEAEALTAQFADLAIVPPPPLKDPNPTAPPEPPEPEEQGEEEATEEAKQL